MEKKVADVRNFQNGVENFQKKICESLPVWPYGEKRQKIILSFCDTIT